MTTAKLAIVAESGVEIDVPPNKPTGRKKAAS